MFRGFVRGIIREKATQLGIPYIPVLQFFPSMALAMHR